MKLKDIIDLKTLQELQNMFADATGFAAITVDFKGRPVLEYSNFSKFCRLLRQNAVCNEACFKSDAHGGLESARREDIYIYKCHTGLIDFAIPIIINEYHVGSIMCGQVLLDENDINKDEINKIESISGLKGNTKFDQNPELIEAYKEIHVVSYEKLIASTKLLKLFPQLIIDQYEFRMKTDSLTEKEGLLKESGAGSVNTEARLYRAQLNSHFLSGTLNTIGKLAFIENADQPQEVTYFLANMYRYVLKTAEESTIVEKKIVKALKYIDDHYKKDIKLEEVAGFVYLSPYYLSKLFKKEIGVTFKSYVTHQKIDAAKKLLEETHMPIINIALELSFNEHNYFSKVFKKVVGMTPSEYRDKKMEENIEKKTPMERYVSVV